MFKTSDIPLGYKIVFEVKNYHRKLTYTPSSPSLHADYGRGGVGAGGQVIFLVCETAVKFSLCNN